MVLFKLFPEARSPPPAPPQGGLMPSGSTALNVGGQPEGEKPSDQETPPKGVPPPQPQQWDESIFDKIYLIQLLLQSLNKSQYHKYQANITKSGGGGSQEYEKIARSIMEKGGVKSMSVA